MANEQTEFVRLNTTDKPSDGESNKYVKTVTFLDADGNPVDPFDKGEPGAGSVDTAQLADNSVTNEKLADGAVTSSKIYDGDVTPVKLAGYNVNHNSIPAVKDDGTGFDFIMPSSIGKSVLTVADTATARNLIGVPTDTITTEAVNAIKNKSQISALKVVASNADAAALAQSVNTIIAALQA